MNTENDVNVSGLVTRLGLNRRQFLAASTGMAAAAAVAAPSATAAPARRRWHGQRRAHPGPRRGIILYTVRDAISRDPATSPYASGFKAVLEELGKIGYQQIEFAGYGQNVNAPGRQRQQPRRRPAPALLARRQRARGRGQPRLHPLDHHRRHARRSSTRPARSRTSSE